jgi:hypothetical protein
MRPCFCLLQEVVCTSWVLVESEVLQEEVDTVLRYPVLGFVCPLYFVVWDCLDF